MTCCSGDNADGLTWPLPPSPHWDWEKLILLSELLPSVSTEAPNTEDGKTVVHLITIKMLLKTNAQIWTSLKKKLKKTNLILKTLHFSPERLQDCAWVSSCCPISPQQSCVFLKCWRRRLKRKKKEMNSEEIWMMCFVKLHLKGSVGWTDGTREEETGRAREWSPVPFERMPANFIVTTRICCLPWFAGGLRWCNSRALLVVCSASRAQRCWNHLGTRP